MAFDIVTPESRRNGTVTIPQLAAYGVLSIVLACAVNLAVLALGLTLFEFPDEFVGGPFGPLAVGPVVVNSAVATVGATVVYGVVRRYSAQPNRTFVRLSALALVLSFGMFFAPDLAGAPPRLYAILGLVHVTTALVVVGTLLRLSTPKRDS